MESAVEAVEYPAKELAVLFDGDAVVYGGSLAGVATALELAKVGKRVCLVEPRTYLGRELTSTGRPWLELQELGSLPEPLSSFAQLSSSKGMKAVTAPDGGRYLPFTVDSLKLYLEDRLLGAGVKLLYASLPVAVSRNDGRLAGLVVGNKSGRQFLGCSALVDASESSTLSRILGIASPATTANVVARTLEFDGVSESVEERLRLPTSLGVLNDLAVVRRGYRSERHRLVEVRFGATEDDGRETDPFTAAALELAWRERVMQVAIHLMTHVPAFERAYLAGSSLESARHGEQASVRGGGVEEPARRSEQASVAGSSLESAQRWEQASVRGDEAEEVVPGLWRLPREDDPAKACRMGAELGTRLGRDAGEAETGAERDARLAVDANGVDARTSRQGDDAPAPRVRRVAHLEVREQASPQPGRDYPLREVGALQVPIVESSRVLVVGGGTSGATAATVAAREGLDTVLVEMNPGLGGTGTYGGVNDYWFGRRVGFAGRLNEAVKEFHDCLRHDFPDSDVPRWNIDAKAHVLAQGALAAGVRVLSNSFVIATITEGRKVRGVVVATRFGPVAVLGEVVIDATGDGDVAAFAGARFSYGAERGRVTMWYSLAQFGIPGHTRNNFTSTVNVGDVEDYTRAILAGRRRTRTGGDIHDHGIYLAPRESRHVLGEVVLTLTDQLLKRAWPDVVNIAYSNNDVKGHTTSDWLRLGLISPNLEVEIPYRAIVPVDCDGLLVVGKAISATHDALPAIRMQADLENLGGVAALAAAQAVRAGVEVRGLDVTSLQGRLVHEGVLPPTVLSRRLERWEPDEGELRALIDSLDGERPLYLYSDMPIGEVFRERIPFVDIVCAGPRAVPLLEEALASSPQGPRRLRLAQALAMVGSSAGVPDLLAAIDQHLSGGVLPPRASGIRHAVAPPDQGAMPEVVYLLHALGMTRDRRAVPVWKRVVDLLANVTSEDIRSHDQDVFDYVDAVCVGAERLGDPAAASILERLHGYPPFQAQSTREPFQADYFLERQAYLEIVIARALARCGSMAGLRTLAGFVEDSRNLLAQHAHAELVALTGVDLGLKERAWRAWLDEHGQHETKPRPWPAPTDAQAYWGAAVLVDEAQLHRSPAGARAK